MKIIAHIKTDFPTKFGVPRQSGVIPENKGKIVFEKEYSDPMAVRGLEDFSHIWVIWEFSKAKLKNWSPTVRPPLLGGNKRMGVFATRSPYRPNPIGLSVLKLEDIVYSVENGVELIVSGCDMMDGTPIYDIKPYLPYADSVKSAVGGFTETLAERKLSVKINDNLLEKLSETKKSTLIAALESDPRPSYQNDSERIYGFEFAGFEVKFYVDDGIITVVSLEKL